MIVLIWRSPDINMICDLSLEDILSISEAITKQNVGKDRVVTIAV